MCLRTPLGSSAKKVRGGILLFLPSHGLSKYIQRLWNQWGVIESIRENGQKRILFEGDADFKILLDRHYEAVEESRTLGARRLTGSIIVAVYRVSFIKKISFQIWGLCQEYLLTLFYSTTNSSLRMDD